jgi:hypothetical protein
VASPLPPHDLKSILIHPPKFSGNFYQQRYLAAKQEKHGRRNMAAEFCLQNISFQSVGIRKIFTPYLYSTDFIPFTDFGNLNKFERRNSWLKLQNTVDNLVTEAS